MANIEPEKKMGPIQSIITLVVGVLFLYWMWSPSPSSSVQSNKIESSLEYKLLFLDKHGVLLSDPDLDKVRFYLGELSGRFQMSSDQIADMTWAAKKDMMKSGIDESVVVILESMMRLSRGKEPSFLKGGYSAMLTLYIMSREHSQ